MKKKSIDIEDTIEQLEKGLGDGPLTLTISCTECQAQFELSKVSLAAAVMLDTPFIEYLRFVQSSTCTSCERNKSDIKC